METCSMGGSFSAQCANLHSVWALKVAVEKMKQFGKLIKTAPVADTIRESIFFDPVS